MYDAACVPPRNATIAPVVPRSQLGLGLADQQRQRARSCGGGPHHDAPSDEMLHVRAALRDQVARKDERRGTSRAFARSRTPSPERQPTGDVAFVRVGRNGGISAGFVLPPSSPSLSRQTSPPAPTEGPNMSRRMHGKHSKRSKHSKHGKREKREKHGKREKQAKREKHSRERAKDSNSSDSGARLPGRTLIPGS